MSSDNPRPGKERSKNWGQNVPLLLLILLLGFSTMWMFQREPTSVLLKYGELLQLLRTEPGNVRFQNVRVAPTEIRGELVVTGPLSDGKEPVGNYEVTRTFRTPRVGLERDTAELVKLLNARVGPAFQGEEEESALRGLTSFLFSVVFIFVAVFLGFMVFRWLAGGSSPFTFGRSRHKVYAQKDLAVTFKDVAGIDEAVAELREIVDFLQNPDKYQALGGKIPKGVLLVGPPGTGKTLLARAVAGEADVPYFSLSGSDFVEMFVGVGASRVRDLFSQAEQKAPAIIFIDELDALGKARGGSAIGGHDEREQTLNALLVEMDGFDSNRGLIIMAATNRPETLDAALMRPGRFDRTVVVDQPDVKGREAILKVHIRDVKMSEDVDLRRIAALTPGSVGADLANIVNEAALLAARNSRGSVTMADFIEAVERGAFGLERKSRIMSPDEKLRIAYHESGHAIVACALPNTPPVQKVTIIPRGLAGGYVWQRAEEERRLHTQTELESQIKILLAGTLSEELIYHDVSTGATNDLERANAIARRMVTEFGMSPLGRISIPKQSQPIFLRGMATDGEQASCSPQTAREVDMEVRRIIDEATGEVREILRERRPALNALAQRLVDKEVVDGAELHGLIDDHSPTPRLVPGTLPAEGTVPREPPPATGERGVSAT